MSTIKHKRFYLGKKYPHIYFSEQEAYCMKYMLQDYTYKRIGQILRLSPHTVAFYSHNMSAKLYCQGKDELIQKVKESDFLSQLEQLE